MAITVTMPQLGETVTEGTILSWAKAPGDAIAEDEVLLEISTDKVDTEVPSPAGGVIQEILVAEGETVSVGTPLAVIGEPGEAAGDATGDMAASPSEEQPDTSFGAEAAPAYEAPAEPVHEELAPAAAAEPATEPAAAPEAPPAMAPAAAAGVAAAAMTVPAPTDDAPRRGVLSPVVRKLAAEHGIDLNQVVGTGDGGRITRSDVMAYIDSGGAKVAVEPEAPPAPAAEAAPAEGPAEEAPAEEAPAEEAPSEEGAAEEPEQHAADADAPEIEAEVQPEGVPEVEAAADADAASPLPPAAPVIAAAAAATAAPAAAAALTPAVSAPEPVTAPAPIEAPAEVPAAAAVAGTAAAVAATTPASEAPASEAPASEAPASEAPASEAPASEAPASEAAVSEAAGAEPAVSTDEAADVAVAPVGADEVREVGRLRRRIADNMVMAKATAAHVWTSVEVDYDNVEKVRLAHKAAFKAQHGFSLTYLPFIARATMDALHAFPVVNSAFHLDEGEHVFHGGVHLGIAVDMNQGGLVVVTVKDADDMRMTGLARDIRDKAVKARDGALEPDDVSGSTFTITNPGPFGSFMSAPIINVPNAAILSTETVAKRASVITLPDGTDTIAIRPIGYLGLTWDHRVFDGSTAVLFLQRIRQNLESWDWEQELS